MEERARFPQVAAKAGHYESFYIKACRPDGGRGDLDPPHRPQAPRRRADRLDLVHPLRPRGRGPRATKVTVAGERALDAGRLLDPRRRRRDRPGRGRGLGRHRGAQRRLVADLRRQPRSLQVPAGRLALRGAAAADQVRRAAARRPLRGPAEIDDESIELAGWPGMIGHNWGTEHAERWVWLEGTGFADAPGTYFDAGAARIKLGRRTSPWVAVGDAVARRRPAPARRPRRDPLGPDRGVAGRPAPSSCPARTSSSAAASRRRRRTSSAGSTPTPRAPSTTPSTARSPTSS